MLTINNTAEEVIHHHRQLNLKDCCYFAAYAWMDVKQVILTKAWRKLVNNIENIQEEDTDTTTTDIKETLSILHVIPGCGDCDNADVRKWFECDETCLIDPDTSVVNETQFESNDDDNVPESFEAFEALEKGLRWYEAQRECNYAELKVLKKLCDLAAKKICDS